VHELAICQALLQQVSEVAWQRGADVVERIEIVVGPLSGVDAALLQHSFAVLRRGSVAAEASLVIEPAGVCVECLVCGACSDTIANRLVCGACGGFRTRLIAGDELRLTRVIVHVTDAAPTDRTNTLPRRPSCVKPVDAPLPDPVQEHWR
jgi:hydrogenase nickel incorporation protein HypA/HybF